MKKIILITLLLAAFGAYAQDATDSIPDWVSKPPASSKMFYSVGIGKSRMMDIAERKAILDANIKLAEQVEPAKVEKIKRTSKSADGRTTEEIIQREIVNAILSDVRILKRFSFQKDEEYTVYVLVEMKKKR
jgi:hypothetical protein